MMTQKPKTIFLTGGTGFLGSALLPALLDAGYIVKALVRKKMGATSQQRLERFLITVRDNEWYSSVKNNVEAIEGDVTKPNLGVNSAVTKRLEDKIDIFFHCAAVLKFDDSKRKELEKTNISGTKNALEFAHALSVKEFHFTSTAYIAGKRTGIVTEGELDRGQEFNNVYEETKFRTEKLIASDSIKSTIYRPSVIMGNSKNGKAYSFDGIYGLAKTLDRWVKIFKKIPGSRSGKINLGGIHYDENGILITPTLVPGRKEKTINVVPVDYVANAIVAILSKQKESQGKVYHIVNHKSPTVGDIQDVVCKNVGMQGRLGEADALAKEPMTKWDRYFMRQLKRYASYFQGEEPTFDDKNTKNILQETSIACPPVDRTLLNKFIEYGVKKNWAEQKA